MSEEPAADMTLAVPFSPRNIRDVVREITAAARDNWRRVGTGSSSAPVVELCPDVICSECVEHNMWRVPGEDHMLASDPFGFSFSPLSSYGCHLQVFKEREEGLLGLSLFAAETCFTYEHAENKRCLLHIVERLRKRFPIEEIEIDDVLMQDEDAERTAEGP